MKYVISGPILIALFNFIFFMGLSTPSLAIENFYWLETQDNVAKLGVDKIWFTNDLNKAVFLRSLRKEQFSKLDQFFNRTAFQIDSKMSHLNDTLYFYNMGESEIQNWIKKNLTAKTGSVWFSIFISKANAESPDCSINTATPGVETKQGQSFFQKFSNIVNGDFIKKIVGCSTQDPQIDEKKNQSLSAENFSNAIKNHWEQLKEIIIQLPNMPLPEDVKQELICDGISIGVFVTQSAALSLTGAGVFVAVPRLFLALKRLMNSVKFLSGKVKAPVQIPVSAKSAVVSTKTLTARLESVFDNQKRFIQNLQAGQKQILDKGGRLAESGKANTRYNELSDWAKAEINVQNDFIKTLNSLEKIKDRSVLSQKISIQTEKAIAEKRIQTLTKAFKF